MHTRSCMDIDHDNRPDIQDVFDHICKEMADRLYRLVSISGGPNTFHAEDGDGTKYLILKRQGHYEVLRKTGMKLALI